jgi:hypothetical protein
LRTVVTLLHAADETTSEGVYGQILLANLVERETQSALVTREQLTSAGNPATADGRGTENVSVIFEVDLVWSKNWNALKAKGQYDGAFL